MRLMKTHILIEPKMWSLKNEILLIFLLHAHWEDGRARKVCVNITSFLFVFLILWYIVYIYMTVQNVV